MVHFQLGQYVKKHRLLTSLTLVRVFKGSKGFQGVPGVSKGFQGFPRSSKGFSGGSISGRANFLIYTIYRFV